MADITVLLVLVVWTGTSIHHTCALTTATPVKIIDYEEIDCKSDLNCYPGQFCHHIGRCVSCIDCSKFRLDSGRTDCAKGKQECGGCSKGFVMDADFGHCMPPVGLRHVLARWHLVIVFGLLVTGAIVFGALCLKYYQIRGRQSVSPESPPEMKLRIQNGNVTVARLRISVVQ